MSRVTALEFWDMSYGEITETIEAYNERQRQELEMHAGFDYALADLVRIGFNDPKRFPRTLQSAYPFVKSTRRKGTWQESKEEFAAIAAAHNRAMGGGGHR